MPAIYPTPAHSDLADGREGEHARSAHPRERTRDPLIDHPRPAPPSCCHLPLLPHRCCHTALATWARLGCLYADDATLLLPCHCYHTATLILPRRCYRAADAALLPLPHCRCGHTAAATLRLLHRILLVNATPAAVGPSKTRPLPLPHPPPPRLPLPRLPLPRLPLSRPPPPRRHRPAAPVPHRHCHRAARDTSPAAATPALGPPSAHRPPQP